MKRLVFLALALVAFVLPASVLAQTSESIRTFNVLARVDADRMLTVREEITYDFANVPHHGIYRDIPVRYSRNGGTYRLPLSILSVAMDSRPMEYTTSQNGDNLRIKIGDPDVTMTGAHTFVINYQTDRAINFFNGEAELYWNVTGNGWQVPIEQTSFALTGPTGFDATTAPAVCYTGPFGSTARECAVDSTSNQVSIVSTSALGVGEGLTTAIRFPKGLIAEPTLAERVWQIIRDNGVLALPVLTLIVMLWLWHIHGRDPKGRGTVVPQYISPRGMAPAELIALKEQDVPTRTITATILDLARRGYLKIDFGEERGLLRSTTTYTFIQQKEADASLTPFEAQIYAGLFASGSSVTLAGLKGSFYKSIPPFKTAVFASLRERGLFEHNPIAVRGKYIGIGVGIIFVVFWLLAGVLNPLTIAALVASAAIIGAVGWFMPRKTREGAAALEEVEGFKWFLSVTEKERLAFHNAPAVKPETFHKFLPAAIAFGVEEKWAEQFSGIDIAAPDYVTGDILHAWSLMHFAHALGGLNTAAAASAYAAPSSAGSGGSGFSGGGSGGGFGGGGGGSW